MSYAIVTIGALLVAEIIISVMLMSYFVTNLDLTPETLITNLSAEWIPQVRSFSQRIHLTLMGSGRI